MTIVIFNKNYKGGNMKSLTKTQVNKSSAVVAQCCAKKSKIISGCHD
jgi:hypothetical protein